MQAELSESKAETRLYNLNQLMTFSFPHPLEMLCIILICFSCPDFFFLLLFLFWMVIYFCLDYRQYLYILFQGDIVDVFKKINCYFI